MDYFDPIAIANSSGVIQERYSYSAFGLVNILTGAFAPRANSNFAWNFLFHGQFRDTETGWDNYGYRYYLPWLGRWPSHDPIEEEGGMNLYGITENNLVSTFDFLGLSMGARGRQNRTARPYGPPNNGLPQGTFRLPNRDPKDPKGRSIGEFFEDLLNYFLDGHEQYNHSKAENLCENAKQELPEKERDCYKCCTVIFSEQGVAQSALWSKDDCETVKSRGSILTPGKFEKHLK